MRSVHITSALVGLLLPATVVAGSPAVTTAAAAPALPHRTPVTAAGDDDGAWSVTSTGPDTWTVTWRAPERLPVAADRPTVVTATGAAGAPAGTPLGTPTLGDDGRTVEVTVTSTTEPQPESLDVVLSGQVLDEEQAPPAADPALERWREPGRELLPVDPGVAGNLPITTSDYERPGIQLPGMPEKVEMVGHVVKPAPSAADPSHPLVVFLHGRHGYCYNPETGREGWRWPCRGAQQPIPSHLGYDYVQRLLASQGYVTVSIAANGINAQDGMLLDGGAAARSQLVQAHLDLWASELAGSVHEVDLDNVVLVGHSRGGEGVSRASLEIPLGADYMITGQVLIGPTNFGRQTTPYVPTVTVLPSCDGDVIDLQGQTYTDLARGLATGDTAMKSSVMAVGANHNFFNTEWTPGLAAAPAMDDWGGKGGVCGKGAESRLTAAQQRRVGKAYVAGAVRLFAGGRQDVRPMFDGSPVRVGSTGAAVVLSHMVGGDREFRVPGVDGSAVGAGASLCKGTTPWGQTDRPLCGRFARAPGATPHWPTAGSLIPTFQAVQLSWTESGGGGGLALDEPLDLSGSDWLDLRTVVDPKVGDVSVRVRLTDAAGSSVIADPVGGNVVPALPHGDRWLPGKYWAQTLRVDAGALSDVDASRVSRIEVVGTSDRGRLWVIDVAAAASSLPAVPAKRVPVVDLGKVRVDEGGDGSRVAEVPFTVTGDVTAPGEFWVYGFGASGAGKPTRLEVDVAPGTDAGVVEWVYEGNELDDRPRIDVQLVGHAVRDVMLRDSQGRVVVVDDDPTPLMSLHAVRPRAAEGAEALFEVRLSEPMGRELTVAFRILRGDGTPLRASDMPSPWLKRWTTRKPGTDPALHKLEVVDFLWFEPGATREVFRVPIRDDARTEGRESLTLRATTGSRWTSAPVTVLVPASD